MAFGDLIAGSTNQLLAGNVSNNNVVTISSASITIGDLIVVVCCQQTALTAGSASDSLGNTYTAHNAGVDAGAASGRMFYTRATTGGTLTSVTVTATSSANDVAIGASAWVGNFATPPIDANPGLLTNDTADPLTCPTTGTLSQATELVVVYMASDKATSIAATSPNLLAMSATGANAQVCIGYQVTAATGSIAPVFTHVGTIVNNVLGTASFKQAVAGDTHLLMGQAML